MIPYGVSVNYLSGNDWAEEGGLVVQALWNRHHLWRSNVNVYTQPSISIICKTTSLERVVWRNNVNQPLYINCKTAVSSGLPSTIHHHDYHYHYQHYHHYHHDCHHHHYHHHHYHHHHYHHHHCHHHNYQRLQLTELVLIGGGTLSTTKLPNIQYFEYRIFKCDFSILTS